ncbi:MAG TPA: (d)CMP kinase, partial [Ktedonobacterales bacterium]|nr:(d)CMP kinase [Ktedonobacterales bacterium]
MAEAPRLPLQIAIDGMVATGKSTVCEAVARRLGILYLDTGVMYRAVALVALEHNTDIDNDDACGAIA